jgi:hypothetical protein
VGTLTQEGTTMNNVIATADEVAKTTNAGDLSITVDIAAFLSALIWPIVLLVVFLTYRKQFPALVNGLASRLSKLEFGGVSIELAKATEFTPDWSAEAFDLRQRAAAMQVNDSTVGTFLTQLREGGDADYALVAYSRILSQRNAFVVTNGGRLGYQHSQHDPQPSIELLKEFLQEVQTPLAPPVLPVEPNSWVVIDEPTNTREHAAWINGESLENILGDDANRSSIGSSELRLKGTSSQLRAILSVPDRFVAVTGEGQRFEYLVNRDVVLELVARQLALASEESS